MIQAVIGAPESQTERVARLVSFCYELDGTNLMVFPVNDKDFTPKYPDNAFACYQAHALRTVARAMGDNHFIWLEADSIPLRPGWRSALEEEYLRSKKEFMLTSDHHGFHDRIGGIGVYGPTTQWIIPEHFPRGGWDGWMIDQIKDIVHFSPLIQHSYGVYPRHCHAQPHRFPRDNATLRPNAVIFHRDKFQDLIPKSSRTRFLHCGDLGDIIAAMPIIRQLGGGDLIVSEGEPVPGMMPRESMRGRMDSLRLLLENEGYITGIDWIENPASIDYDLTHFRVMGWNRIDNLAQWQARSLGIEDLDLSPWISLPRNHSGRVIISRSLRYHNPDFPWQEIARKYGHRLLFIGLKEEHSAFEDHVGKFIELAKTKTLFEAAEHISAASICFMNQSAPFWIAVALGKKIVQETYIKEPNSIVCRDNAWYSRNWPEIEHIRNLLK